MQFFSTSITSSQVIFCTSSCVACCKLNFIWLGVRSRGDGSSGGPVVPCKGETIMSSLGKDSLS